MVEYLPLLEAQRALYKLPRGMERFKEYLRTMINADGSDIVLPLMSMNPMGKDHVPRFIDRLFSVDAEGAGARAVEEYRRSGEGLAGSFKACLVVADDLLGGWTNRYTSELEHRFGQSAVRKRGFIVPLLWTSEEYDAGAVSREVLECLYRTAYIQRHGYAETLRDMLSQEGYVSARSGAARPTLSEEELDYTREVLRPHLGSRAEPLLIAALFGDAAAGELGYPPIGLSPRAGLELARRDALPA